MTTEFTSQEISEAVIALRAIKARELLMAAARYCPDGRSHVWQYRASSPGVGRYFCQMCSTVLTKHELKDRTD